MNILYKVKKYFPKVRLFHKFLLGIGFASLIPMFFLGYFLIEKFQFAIETPITELHLNVVESIKDRIENEIQNNDKMAYFLADILSKMDWQSRQNALLSLLSQNSLLKEVSMGTLSGREVLKINLTSEKNDDLTDLSSLAYFKKAIEMKSRVVEVSGDKDDIIIVYPFSDFFLKFAINKSDFFKNLNLSNIGSDGIILILSSNSEILASSQEFYDVKDAPFWPVSTEALKNLSSAAVSFKDKRGKEYLAAYSFSPSISAAIIVRQSRADAYKYALSMRKEAIVILLTLAFSVLPVAYLISKKMSRPILEITQAAQKVSQGDFNQSVYVDSSDELKDLSETFNNMIRQLKLYSEMQIEKILKERKNTQSVLFSTEDGIIMLDINWAIQLINRKAASILKIDSANCEGKNFVSEIKEEKLKDIFINMFRGKIDSPIEFELEDASVKRVFKASVKEITSPDKNGRDGYLIALYDITLSKELERIKEEFLHSITHDLRNPTSAIKGFVEFMLKEIPGPVTQAQRKMLVSIDRAAFRLLGMVNNILDIAKMEAGKMDINISEVDIVEIAKKSCELMESLASKKNIKFEILPNSPYIVSCDPQLMERVFINLIGNAIKFTDENGKITLGIRQDIEWLYGWVEDTGDGLPKDYVDKVFEKFEQVKGQKTGGTGLGLTICKYITKAHLGDIWAEQDEGKGARFVFKIPIGLKKHGGKLYVSR